MNGTQIEDIYPLSPMQQGMLFHSLYASESREYFQQISWIFRGGLNISVLKNSWQRVVDRYSILRTDFEWEDVDEPVQIVYPQVELPFEIQDWRGLAPTEQKERLDSFLQADRNKGFDLSAVPLMRLVLSQLTEDSYQFIWSSHHILLDGWSTLLVLKEVFANYNALCKGNGFYQEHPRPYRDYIAWLKSQDLSQAEKYWRQRLQGLTAPTVFGVDRTSQSLSHSKTLYDEQEICIPASTLASLRSTAKNHKLTLNTIAQGAWALMLSCYSGEVDVVFGTTVSGRPGDLPGVESMVGLFINTLPMRVQMSPKDSLQSWLKKLQDQQVEMRQYEYSPLVKVQGWTEVPRDKPLFESLFIFENYPRDASTSKAGPNLEITDVRAIEWTNYPITIEIAARTDLLLRVKYDCQRFETSTITRLLEHYTTILESIAANPEQRLSEISLLTDAERQQLLIDWNATEKNYPREKCFHHLFEDQAKKTPNATAVVLEDEEVTYKELNVRANQLAHHLQQHGVGPDVLVGICMERSPEMLVGLLGIMKAGGAYVPLDPSYPKERLAYMVEDAEPRVLLTQNSLRETIFERREAKSEERRAELSENEFEGNASRSSFHALRVICLDSDWQEIAKESESNPEIGTQSTNLAYVIYTSGSTGKPKGVAIQHQTLVNFLTSMAQEPGLNQEDTLLAVTTLSFDIAGLELYLPLLSGARLILASREVASDARRLRGLLTESGATIMQATPATWRMLVDSGWQGSDKLKMLCGGEALPRELANQLIEKGAGLWNMYGPTETTIWSSVYQFASKEGIVPVGPPIANTQIYVLDTNLQPVPIGVYGEVYIGGEGLARGYLNRVQLTAEKFMPNPFNREDGARMYRTGDLARYLPDGCFEFQGRIDHQVKIRGFRIELGEIETTLGRHESIDEVVVVAREDESNNQYTEKYLAAYLISKAAKAPTVSELRRYLLESLPEYMVPTAFIFLDTFPLTPNGKVDRKAFPGPEGNRPELELAYIAPQNEIERSISGVWRKVLGVEGVGMDDNFFDLGGHSLLLVQVQSKLKKIFNRDVSIVRLFKYPTINTLAKSFSAEEDESVDFQRIHEMAKKQKDAILRNSKPQMISNRKGIND